MINFTTNVTYLGIGSDINMGKENLIRYSSIKIRNSINLKQRKFGKSIYKWIKYKGYQNIISVP